LNVTRANTHAHAMRAIDAGRIGTWYLCMYTCIMSTYIMSCHTRTYTHTLTPDKSALLMCMAMGADDEHCYVCMYACVISTYIHEMSHTHIYTHTSCVPLTQEEAVPVIYMHYAHDLRRMHRCLLCKCVHISVPVMYMCIHIFKYIHI